MGGSQEEAVVEELEEELLIPLMRRFKNNLNYIFIINVLSNK